MGLYFSSYYNWYDASFRCGLASYGYYDWSPSWSSWGSWDSSWYWYMPPPLYFSSYYNWYDASFWCDLPTYGYYDWSPSWSSWGSWAPPPLPSWYWYMPPPLYFSSYYNWYDASYWCDLPTYGYYDWSPSWSSWGSWAP